VEEWGSGGRGESEEVRGGARQSGGVGGGESQRRCGGVLESSPTFHALHSPHQQELTRRHHHLTPAPPPKAPNPPVSISTSRQPRDQMSALHWQEPPESISGASYMQNRSLSAESYLQGRQWAGATAARVLLGTELCPIPLPLSHTRVMSFSSHPTPPSTPHHPPHPYSPHQFLSLFSASSPHLSCEGPEMEGALFNSFLMPS
jgi:hypothetical protein